MTQQRLALLRVKLVNVRRSTAANDPRVAVLAQDAILRCDDYELCERTVRGPDGAPCATDCAVALKLEQQLERLADALGIAAMEDNETA